MIRQFEGKNHCWHCYQSGSGIGKGYSWKPTSLFAGSSFSNLSFGGDFALLFAAGDNGSWFVFNSTEKLKRVSNVRVVIENANGTNYIDHVYLFDAVPPGIVTGKQQGKISSKT